MARQLTREAEVAWAAGLFEGEGCIRFCKHDRGLEYIRLSIKMTDRDVLQHFADVVGAEVKGPYAPSEDKPHHKPVWSVTISKTRKSLNVLEAFWPYLGDRRRAKAQEVTALWEENSHSRPVRFPPEQVEEILAQKYLGLSAIELGVMYDCSRQYIHAIVRGERSRELPDACEIVGGRLTSAVSLAK